MALPIRRTTNGSHPAARPDRPERWDPLTELDLLNRRLAGYLDFWRQGLSLVDGLFTPPADIEETDDAYLVDNELPGFREHDLDTGSPAAVSPYAANARRRSASASSAAASAPSAGSSTR